MLKIIKNPDNATYEKVTEAVKNNGGYCPCELTKSLETRCPCKTFRDQEAEGTCHCGRYVKKYSTIN